MLEQKAQEISHTYMDLDLNTWNKRNGDKYKDIANLINSDYKVGQVLDNETELKFNTNDIDILVTHPDYQVIIGVSRLTTLNVDTLKIIFKNKELPPHVFETVIKEQAEKGLTIKDLAEATGKSISDVLNNRATA